MKLFSDSNFKIAFVSLVALLLGACGGDDGDDGSPGDPGGLPAMTITQINLTIDKVELKDGIATLDYQVRNQDDEAIIGIPSATYIAAQLLPQGVTNAGDSSQWQYFTSENCSTANCSGTVTDYKNGHYSYTFSSAFDGLNQVTFLNDATQRIVIKVGGDSLADGTLLPTTNQHLDWQVSGAQVAYTRDILTIDSCNACHTDLAFHGGKYNQIETCVTCHNAQRVSNPDNIFPQMIHAKHLGVFPQSLANCQSCHTPNTVLAENENWNRVPTMQSCGSCHTNINFPAGQGHPMQADNSNCVACHNAQWTTEVHSGADDAAALAQFAANIQSASMTADGTVTIDVSLNNPATGETYSDSADKQNFLNDLRVYANWGTSFDYATRSAISIKLRETSPLSGSNGVYRYQLSGLTIPAGTESDKGTLVLQGRVCAQEANLVDCATANVDVLPIKSSHQFFNMTALSDTGRRIVVTNETCGTCHGNQKLNFHGARNDLEGQCQVCHNHNMLADSSVANPSNATADFKQLIHSLHSANYAGFETLNYPSNIGNCAQCHTQDSNGVLTAALPLNSAVQPLALDNGMFTSAATAICSNCHSSDTAKTHMTQQGGVFAGTQADATAGTESCAVCHGEGKAVAVDVVHPVSF